MIELLLPIAVQVAPIAPPAPPPPPMVPAPPPYAPPAPPVFKATAVLEADTEKALDFVLFGDRGVVLLRVGRTTRLGWALDDPATVLRFLADRRAAPLWPALLDWAGADLTKLRDRSLARMRRLHEAGVPAFEASDMVASSVKPSLRATLRFAEALRASGRGQEAAALLRRTREAIAPDNPDRLADWVMLTVRIAGNLAADHDRPAAIRVMEEARARFPTEQGYAINFDVNRAAFLVEEGSAAEGLALVDAALAAFKTYRARDGGDRVPGSDRQFGWVRACALHKLGRVDEAKRAMKPVLAFGEPVDRQFVLAPGSSIRWRMYRCIGDAAGAAAVLAREFGELEAGPEALLLLQPGRDDPPAAKAFRAEVARHPVLAPLLADRFQPLAPALVPALNRWR